MPDKADLKGMLGGLVAALGGRTGIPEGCHAIEGFDVKRYLGRWYEIARLDHSFERDMTDVTAHYGLREDGGITVINRGFVPAGDEAEKGEERGGEWDQAEGRAYFEEAPTRGRLRVSFFGPFYAGYNILMLDEHYQNALVAGPNHGFLWFLSRTPTLDEAHFEKMRQLAERSGFDTGALIRLSHARRAHQPPDPL